MKLEELRAYIDWLTERIGIEEGFDDPALVIAVRRLRSAIRSEPLEPVGEVPDRVQPLVEPLNAAIEHPPHGDLTRGLLLSIDVFLEWAET